MVLLRSIFLGMMLITIEYDVSHETRLNSTANFTQIPLIYASNANLGSKSVHI